MKKGLLSKLAIVLLLFAGYSWASAQGDAELMLRPSVAEAVTGNEVSVDIVLKNPNQEKVISVRSWLTYDPALLEAVNIDTSASEFSLSAPGEDTISVGEGRVKIGRSNISGGSSTLETVVATVSFRVIATSGANSTIGFYDYQVSELGHTSVNIIDAGFPLNILSKAPQSIQLSLNPGVAAPAPVVQPTPVFTPVPVPQPTSPFADNLIRPLNLLVNTGPGYVDLKWDMAPDPNRMGYNLYYGKASGQYTRRRTIGSFDNYRLDGLSNGETYYFAIAPYDQFNREGDYSNEVGAIINQPLSSTAPFQTLIQASIAIIPTQPQNGPLVGWLAFSAAGLSAAIIFKPKKSKKIPISS